MKVLYFVGTYGQRLGSEIVATNVINYMSENKGVDYVVITPLRCFINDECDRCGIENYYVKYPFYAYLPHKNKIINFFKRCILLFVKTIESFLAVRKLSKLVDFDHIDLIHSNLSRNLIGAQVARKRHIPHVWHIQELAEGHYSTTMLLNKQIEYMNNNAVAFIVVSNAVRDSWCVKGLCKDKIIVVYNGISCKYKKKSYNDKFLKVVMLGLYSEEKGQKCLIDAVCTLSNEIKKQIKVDFYGLGDMDYMNKLKKQIALNGLSNQVLINGYIDNNMERIAEYDVGVNLSRGEAFGMTTIEYMGCGLCVIATNRGASSELITDGETGYLIDFNDYNALAQTITYLCENRMKICEIGENASVLVGKEYSLKKQIDRIYDIYNKMIGENNTYVE